MSEANNCAGSSEARGVSSSQSAIVCSRNTAGIRLPWSTLIGRHVELVKSVTMKNFSPIIKLLRPRSTDGFSISFSGSLVVKKIPASGDNGTTADSTKVDGQSQLNATRFAQIEKLEEEVKILKDNYMKSFRDC